VLRFQDFASKLLSRNILFEFFRQLDDSNRPRGRGELPISNIARTVSTFVFLSIPLLISSAQTRAASTKSSISEKLIPSGIRPTPFVTSPLDYADVALFS
jgi:hypothetical protein